MPLLPGIQERSRGRRLHGGHVLRGHLVRFGCLPRLVTLVSPLQRGRLGEGLVSLVTLEMGVRILADAAMQQAAEPAGHPATAGILGILLVRLLVGGHAGRQRQGVIPQPDLVGSGLRRSRAGGMGPLAAQQGDQVAHMESEGDEEAENSHEDEDDDGEDLGQPPGQRRPQKEPQKAA